MKAMSSDPTLDSDCRDFISLRSLSVIINFEFTNI